MEGSRSSAPRGIVNIARDANVERLSAVEVLGGGRFAVRRCLGRGAFGTVYEVFDAHQNVPLALKVLRPRDASGELWPHLYRFKQEFRALADIAHPNLVTYHELFAEEDAFYLTMELVDGTDFLSYVEGAPGAGSPHMTTSREGASFETTVTLLDGETLQCSSASSVLSKVARPGAQAGAEQRVRVIHAEKKLDERGLDRLRGATCQIALALTTLHAAGKLHRDIKPSNVLVTPGGRVVVLDFGLAVDAAGKHLRGDVAGTPAFMAPEVLEHAPCEASDFYALGVMMYEALTGSLPFSGSIVSMFLQKQRPPPELPASLPPDLAALCLELLSPDLRARPTGPEILRRLGVIAPRMGERPARRVFVGRQQELAALHAAFAEARAGRTAIAFVAGPSGSGKSALVQRFLDEVIVLSTAGGERAEVVQGRSYELESVPYKALDSAVDALFSLLADDPRASEGLSPNDAADLGALARVFPVANQVAAIRDLEAFTMRAPDKAIATEELRRRAARALRALLTALAARGPLVLFIDDLQWGDRESALLLLEILAPPSPPLLLIGAFRSDERATSPFLAMLEPALQRDPPPGGVREVRVDMLGDGDARALASALFESQSDVLDRAKIDSVVREARGNPFFLGELMEHVRERRSLAGLDLDRAVVDRVARLPEGARRLVEVIAVAGARLPAAVAGVAAGMGNAQRLDEGVVAGLRKGRLLRTFEGGPLRPRSEGYERAWIDTYHDRIREALIARLDPAVRRAHHAALAAAWASAGDADPETLGGHYEQAGSDREALDCLVAAAERAAGKLAFEHAAGLYDRAGKIAARAFPARSGALALARAEALALCGRREQAARAFLTLAEGAPNAVDLRRKAAEHLLRSGHVDEGLAILRGVARAFGFRWPSSTFEAVAHVALLRARLGLRGRGYVEAPAARVPPDVLRTIDLCGSITFGLRFIEPLAASAFQGRYVAMALDAGEPGRVALALAAEAGMAAIEGTRRGPLADDLARQALAIATRLSDVRATAAACFIQGGIGYMSGDWPRARASCEQAEALLEERGGGAASESDLISIYLFTSLYYMGDLDELERRGRLAEGAAERGDAFASTWALIGPRAVARMLRTGDVAALEAGVSRGIAGWSQQGFHMQHQYAARSRVEAHLYAGRAIDAHALYRRTWGEIRRSLLLFAQVGAILAHEMRARVAIAAAASLASDPQRGLDDRQDALLREAVESAGVMDKAGALWGSALALAARAGIASLRSSTRAAVLLGDAERAFQRCSMALHAAAARLLRGLAIGGAAGDALRDEAERALRGRGALDPLRTATCLIPGRWRSST